MPLEQNFQRVLILGGSCQLALHLAARLLKEDIRPLLSYRNDIGKRKIQTRLKNMIKMVDLVHLDFSDPATLDNLSFFLDKHLGYLVDFAQSDFESLVAGADDEIVSDYFYSNLSFRAAVLKRAARAMLPQRCGRMVFISSTAAARPNPGQGFYAAVKLAAEALYRNLGIEMSSKGISTAILRPGYVNAGRGERYLKSQGKAALKLNRSGRIMSVEDIISALMFLLQDKSAAINATVLTVDGGMTAAK